MPDPKPAAPRRVQQRRAAGWRKPEGAVAVGRGTMWGNPFAVGVELRVEGAQDTPVVLDRAAAVALYRLYVAQYRMEGRIRAALRGRDLMCWCPEGEPCHGDVLLAIANGPS